MSEKQGKKEDVAHRLASGEWTKRKLLLLGVTLSWRSARRSTSPASNTTKIHVKFIQSVTVFDDEKCDAELERSTLFDKKGAEKWHLFAIKTSTTTFVFGVLSEKTRNEWIEAIRNARIGHAELNLRTSLSKLWSIHGEEDMRGTMHSILMAMRSEFPMMNELEKIKSLFSEEIDKEIRSSSDLVQSETDSSAPPVAKEEILSKDLDVAPHSSWEIDPSDVHYGEMIAEGFFGEVYRGRVWGKEVAIKRLKQVNMTADVVDDVRKEVNVMCSLRHPNIVLLMGFSFAMPHPFMVTELLEGNLYVPLRDTRTTDSSFCQMVLDTLCGMRYLHSMHVVHFDLKPLNLLVDTNGTVKISDFGVSKFLRGKQESISRDSEMSTILYMSPESIFEGSFDFKTDIFSFGMVLYEMMHVREHPDRDFCVDDTVAYDLIREPLMKKGFPLCPPWWPPEIVNIIKTCLVEKPKERPSFEELTDRWESYLSKEKKEDPWFLRRYCLERMYNMIVKDPASFMEKYGIFLPQEPLRTLLYGLETSLSVLATTCLCLIPDLSSQMASLRRLHDVIEDVTFISALMKGKGFHLIAENCLRDPDISVTSEFLSFLLRLLSKNSYIVSAAQKLSEASVCSSFIECYEKNRLVGNDTIVRDILSLFLRLLDSGETCLGFFLNPAVFHLIIQEAQRELHRVIGLHGEIGTQVSGEREKKSEEKEENVFARISDVGKYMFTILSELVVFDEFVAMRVEEEGGFHPTKICQPTGRIDAGERKTRRQKTKRRSKSDLLALQGTLSRTLKSHRVNARIQILQGKSEEDIFMSSPSSPASVMSALTLPETPGSVTSAHRDGEQSVHELVLFYLHDVMLNLRSDEVHSPDFIEKAILEKYDQKLVSGRESFEAELRSVMLRMREAVELSKTESGGSIYLGSEWNASDLSEIASHEIGMIILLGNEGNSPAYGLFSRKLQYMCIHLDTYNRFGPESAVAVRESIRNLKGNILVYSGWDDMRALLLLAVVVVSLLERRKDSSIITQIEQKTNQKISPLETWERVLLEEYIDF